MAEQHEKALVPQIRFTGFTDPWEQRKLGEVARRVTRKNENGDSDLPLTISAQYGLVDQRTFFNSQVASKDMSGYFLLHRGEFAYNKSTSTDSPWGAIKRLEKYDMGCVSTLYICFELLSGDPDFLVTYYETDRWYKSVQLIAAEGARNHGLLNIAPDDFFETQICIPKRIDEQRRIGAFFDRLDSLITLHQRKYDKLCVLKKTMLDKMFPKGGSLYPEIRFAGFTDPWEQRKLGELYQKNDERNTDGLGSERTLSVASMTFNSAGNGADDSSLPNYKRLRLGDIAFEGHTNKEFAYGRFVLNDAGNGIMSPRFTCLRPIVEQEYSFWKYFIHSEKVMRPILVNSTKSGTMMNELVVEDFLKQEILVPSLPEQRQIGAFFDRLDSLITLHQRKLELLRNIKKSMLDKMFV